MKDIENKAQNLVDYAYNEQASDVHLAAGRVPVVRIYGELIKIPHESHMTHSEVLGVLAFYLKEEKLIDEFLEEKEIDFAYEHRGEVRLRGNAYFREGEVSIALRIIPEVKTLKELNLPEELKLFARRKQGFFLIVGPVGQGKSTTMAAMIDIINKERTEHILTIEQPIEYVFNEKLSIIDQREVGLDTKTFHSGLKAAFRQDANILMLGEMRDRETIKTAVTAAETGHLVLSTLHTNNAAQTIDRIIDSFPGDQQNQIRNQLSSSLIGIFSQRLVPAVKGDLVPAYELLVNTPAVANLIREGRTHEIQIMIETGSKHGMIDMNQRLASLVRKGVISLEDARRYAFSERVFDRLVG